MSEPTLPAGRLPIKLDATSNGEFEPVPLEAVALYARERALAAMAEGQRRLATSRRGYLTSLIGAAATLSAFNEAFAAAGQRGGHYALPKESPFELASAWLPIAAATATIASVPTPTSRGLDNSFMSRFSFRPARPGSE